MAICEIKYLLLEITQCLKIIVNHIQDWFMKVVLGNHLEHFDMSNLFQAKYKPSSFGVINV